MQKNVLVTLIVGVLLLAMALVSYFVLFNKNEVQTAVEYIHNEGETQGTTYSITYKQPQGVDLHSKIEARLHEFDLSLSTYEPTSIISRINRNDTTVRIDVDFELMFKVAAEVSHRTNGAFDITVGPLVKAWGFAFGNSSHARIPNVKALLPYVGYQKVKIENYRLIKENANIMIDANAIAQGQSADVIAKLLQENGCENYMVEIGGEIVCKGLSPKSQKWRIGIDKPIDDSTKVNRDLQAVLSISDCALTTSGNYRKFYYLNGKKYPHEIDPHTGFPVEHNLLSATVVAPTCIQADAYATAFMIMGIEKSLKLCKTIHGMECYLIYSDNNGRNQVVFTDGFKKYLSQ